jgi:hypothetical protein
MSVTPTARTALVLHVPAPAPALARPAALDRLAHRLVALAGTPVDLAAQPWLDGPVGGAGAIGFEYVDELCREEALVRAPAARPQRRLPGLLGRFADLAGPDFDPAAVDPRVVDFYERTAAYRLELWSRWTPIFRPLGWLIARLFTRRLRQLEMPLDPLDTAAGLESQVEQLADAHTGAARTVIWARRLEASKQVLFVGAYALCRVPGHDGPCVRTVFPLPGGSATVVLRPRNAAGGALVLESCGKRFGDPGFYLVHRPRHERRAAVALHVPVFHERIRVFPRADGALGTDHDFILGGATFLRFRYRISTVSCGPIL